MLIKPLRYIYMAGETVSHVHSMQELGRATGQH
jgi:hypothetical protein